MNGHYSGQTAAKIFAALLLLLVPTIHPMLIHVAGVASHLLWFIHVLPVSLMSYYFGVRGAVVTSLASLFLLIAGERYFGGGDYGVAAEWEMVLSLAIALQITNTLIAIFTLYAGQTARKLQHMLYTHPLTGLPNRRSVEERLKSAYSNGNGQSTVLFIDLDDFDSINYTFGHACGDAVLLEIASRLNDCLPVNAMLGHWAGDKFVVFLNNRSWRNVESFIAKFQAVIEVPVIVNGVELKTLSAGIGIAVNSQNGTSKARLEHLLQDADTALSRAKQSGRGGMCVFEGAMKTDVKARLTILNDLLTAIKDDELLNYYQPIHNTDTNAISGVEALVRWQHPARGFVSPGEFIPIAEQTGLIVKLGEQVMHRAFRDFSLWRKAGLCDEHFLLSINIAPAQLAERDFIAQVKLLCRKFDIDPATVVLEITESEMLQSQQVSIRVLRQLAGMGFNIAIDDFGSGYSSLNYLHKLPVNILKIDREIVQQIGDGRIPLVRPIAEIARSFGFKMIAEGIESAKQQGYLKALSVEYLQGFLLSRPMSKEDLENLLKPTLHLVQSA